MKHISSVLLLFSFVTVAAAQEQSTGATFDGGMIGRMCMAVQKTTGAALASNGQLSPLQVDSSGNLRTSGDVTVGAVTRNEDSAHVSTHAALNTLGLVRQDTAAGMAADGDYVFGAVDSANRQYVNPWGANHTEWFRACSGSDVTGTTATEVVPATASKYNYLTGVNCTNTDATVNTRVNIVQETAVGTEILWQLNLAAVTGSDGFSFDPPLKATAVNKNIGVTPITTSAEVRCCMEGFVSAN